MRRHTTTRDDSTKDERTLRRFLQTQDNEGMSNRGTVWEVKLTYRDKGHYPPN